MSVIFVKPLTLLDEALVARLENIKPLPMEQLACSINGFSFQIPDPSYRPGGQLILPPNGVLKLHGEPDETYWVNGTVCINDDMFINTLPKSQQVLILKIENPAPIPTFYPPTIVL